MARVRRVGRSRRPVVLQRTVRDRPGCYGSAMMMKTFSYLMIGAFVSGLVMTLVGSISVLAGL